MFKEVLKSQFVMSADNLLRRIHFVQYFNEIVYYSELIYLLY